MQRIPFAVSEPAARPDPISLSTGIPLPQLGPNYLDETIAFLSPPEAVTDTLIVRASDVNGRLCIVAVSAESKPETDAEGGTFVPSVAHCTVLSKFPEEGLSLALTIRASSDIYFEGNDGYVMMTTVSVRWAADGTVSQEYQELTPVLP